MSVVQGNDQSPLVITGNGSPEGVVAANPGTLYEDTTNGVLYVKQTGASTTGWGQLGQVTSNLPVVASALALPTAPSVDAVYADKAARRLTRAVTAGGVYAPLTDAPQERIVPRQFQDPAWIDANGVSTVGMGRADLVTAAEIAAHTEWMGKYYTTDTRDFVCLQEAIYHAFAKQGPNGQGDIAWNGSNAVASNRPIYVTYGAYYITRPLWNVGLQGGTIEGAGTFQVEIQQRNKNFGCFWTDGIAYSTIEGIHFTNYQGANRTKPLLDLDNFGGNSTGNVWNGVTVSAADFTTARPVTAALNPSLTVAGSPWTANQYAGYYVVITAGVGVGQVFPILSNTSNKLFIDGQWEIEGQTGFKTPPTSSSRFAIVAALNQVGAIFYAEAGLASTVEADFSGLGIVDNTTQAYIGGTDSGEPASTTDTLVTITSHTAHQVTWNNATTPVTLWLSPYVNPDNSLGTQGPRGRSMTINDMGVIVIAPSYHGTVASADNACTLSVSGVAWTNNDHAGLFAEIVGGTGAGQILPVFGNNANTLFFDSGSAGQGYAWQQFWQTLPDTSSTVRFLSRPAFHTQMQSNTVEKNYFEGTNVAIYCAVTRAGGTVAMGSENQFIRNLFGPATLAGLSITGANALNNIIVGGDFEGCVRYGVWLPYGGSIDIWRAHFGAPTYGSPVNIGNGQKGYDVYADFGNTDFQRLYSVRSESRKVLAAFNLALGSAHDVPVLGEPIGRAFAANDGHVWQVGDLVVPSGGFSTYGMNFVVVKTSGDGTAGAEPTWPWNFGSPQLETSGASGTGGTISVVQYNYNAFAGGAMVLDHVITVGAQVRASGISGLSSSVTNSYFTRRDWDVSQLGSLSSGPQVRHNNVVNPLQFGQGGTQVPYHVGYAFYSGIDVLYPYRIGQSALIFGSQTNNHEVGLGTVDAAGNNVPILALLEDSSWTGVILGKAPASGTDQPGLDQRIAGGQGTGAGLGGKLHLQVATHGATGSTPNPFVDAVVLNEDLSAELKGNALIDGKLTTSGQRVKSKESFNVAPGTGFTPTPKESVFVTIPTNAAGTITMNNPTNAVDGQRFTATVYNNSGATQNVAVGTAFLGTWASIATGLQSSITYEYNTARNKWVPVTQQTTAV